MIQTTNIQKCITLCEKYKCLYAKKCVVQPVDNLQNINIINDVSFLTAVLNALKKIYNFSFFNLPFFYNNFL